MTDHNQTAATMAGVTLERMLPVAQLQFAEHGTLGARSKAYVAAMYVYNDTFAPLFGQVKVKEKVFLAQCTAALAATGNATNSNKAYITKGKSIGYTYSEKIEGAITAYLNNPLDNTPRSVAGVFSAVYGWYKTTFQTEVASEEAMANEKKTDEEKRVAMRAKFIRAVNAIKKIDVDLLHSIAELAKCKADVLDAAIVLTDAQRKARHTRIATLILAYQPKVDIIAINLSDLPDPAKIALAEARALVARADVDAAAEADTLALSDASADADAVAKVTGDADDADYAEALREELATKVAA